MLKKKTVADFGGNIDLFCAYTVVVIMFSFVISYTFYNDIKLFVIEFESTIPNIN